MNDHMWAVGNSTGHSRAGASCIRFNRGSDWERRWREFLWHLRQLRAEYDAEPEFVASTQQLQVIVEATLAACYDVADWFRANGPEVREGAGTFKATDPDIRRCGDYVNTVKHSVRQTPGKNPKPEVQGELLCFKAGPPMELIIEFTLAGAPVDSRDALELAEACEAAWHRFFAARGIKPAVW